MRPAGGDDLAATLCRHTGAVTVAALANQLAGLIGSLHGPSPGPCSGMATGFPLGKIGRPSLSCKRGGAARKAAQVAGLWRKGGGESMPKAHPATMPRGSTGPAPRPVRALKTLIIRSRDAVGVQRAFDREKRQGVARGRPCGKADDAEVHRAGSVIERLAPALGRRPSGWFRSDAILDAHAQHLFARQNHLFARQNLFAR